MSKTNINYDKKLMLELVDGEKSEFEFSNRKIEDIKAKIQAKKIDIKDLKHAATAYIEDFSGSNILGFVAFVISLYSLLVSVLEIMKDFIGLVGPNLLISGIEVVAAIGFLSMIMSKNHKYHELKNASRLILITIERLESEKAEKKIAELTEEKEILAISVQKTLRRIAELEQEVRSKL